MSSDALSTDVQAVAGANDRFALDLHARLRAGPGHRCCSPSGVHAAPAMTAGAAHGATRDPMAKLRRRPADRDKGPAGFVGDLPGLVPVDFRADRPFLFPIRDVEHGTILFLGRPTDPKG